MLYYLTEKRSELKVNSLKLKNFRNYDLLNVEFDGSTNIFYGNNAQGKTNILEAVYLSGTTKSHRGSKDRDMIRFGEDESHIETVVEKNGISYQIDMHLKKNSPKGIAINKMPIRKASELFGIVNLVFFSPEDLNIIKNGPAERRRFIDLELSQLDKVYLNNLSNYNRIVNQRNHLLKELSFGGKKDLSDTPEDLNIIKNGPAERRRFIDLELSQLDKVYLNNLSNYNRIVNQRNHLLKELSFGGKKDLSDTLEIWELQMVQYGERLIARRKEFVEQINGIIAKIHQRLTGGKESLKIIYEPSTGDLPFEQALNRYRERDLRMKSTTVGPHRDDIGFLIGDMDIRKYGSQGQQRTAALSLKLSEIELVKLATHDTPILLLDDVLSELDKHRQNYLLDSIHDIQTLITCTGVEDFVNHRFSINKVFHVQNGQVTKEN